MCPWVELVKQAGLDRLSKGEPLDALSEAVGLDEFRPAYPVFWFGGELRVAAAVQIEREHLT